MRDLRKAANSFFGGFRQNVRPQHIWLILVVCLGSSWAHGENLLKNPGFEGTYKNSIAAEWVDNSS